MNIAGFPRSGNHRVCLAVAYLSGAKDLKNAPTASKSVGWTKTHDKDVKGKTLYVIRDPRDVAVSVFKTFPYFKTIEQAVDYVKNGDPEFPSDWKNIGSWQENVMSYRGRSDVLEIRYEEWNEVTIKRIADFIGVNINQSQVSEVLGIDPEPNHIKDDEEVGIYQEFPETELLSNLSY